MLRHCRISVLARFSRSSAPLPRQAPPPRRLELVGDEIPQARRTTLPFRSARQSRTRTLTRAGLLLLALVAALAIVFPGLINRATGPSALNSLGVRPSADGRLLGHLPYGEVDREELVSIAPGVQLQRDAARALQEMQAAARSEGVELAVLSAYRSVATQNTLFFGVKSQRNQTARERARVSAPPGYSEHSTGYAVDLGDATAPETNLSAAFDQTSAFAWLKANAPRFQFTLSFPEGNAQGVNYEPWHWRFEGTAQALRVFEPAQRLSR